MEINRYLERINYSGDLSASISTIRSLAIAHQQSVPYENLDCHLLRPVTLDIDSIYNKIVLSNRGGGCYELNSLFGTLLRKLGFTVDYLSGRVFGRDFVGKEFDHLTLRVISEDKPYLVDVGFGDGFYEPMLLNNGSSSAYCQNQFELSINENQCTLLSMRDDSLVKGLAFSLLARKLSDFEQMNSYHSRNPFSLRSSAVVITRATNEGRISLVGNRLTTTTPKSKEHVELHQETVLDVLEKKFGVRIPYFPKKKSSRLSMRIRRKLILVGRRIRALAQRA